MLYTGKPGTDFRHAAAYATTIYQEAGVARGGVDGTKLFSVITNSYRDFPTPPGLEAANVFKKAATFVCYLMDLRPFDTPLPSHLVGNDGRNPVTHVNAYMALEIALESLYNGTVQWEDGTIHKLSNRITLSKHSHVDIVDALCSGITLQHHGLLIAALFEQMAYKTNPFCQYPAA